MNGERPDDECACLMWLRSKGDCWLDEFPDFVSIDTMRGLDTDGLIEVHPWSRNAEKKWIALFPPGWCSPATNAVLVGPWSDVWRQYSTESEHSFQRLRVRLTDAGHTATRRECNGLAGGNGRGKKNDGWTASELKNEAEAADASCGDSTFAAIRRLAGIAAGTQHTRFSPRQIRELAQVAQRGAELEDGRRRSFRDGEKIATAWLMMIGDLQPD